MYSVCVCIYSNCAYSQSEVLQFTRVTELVIGDVMMTSCPAHLLQGLGEGLPLLPPLVDPKEGRDGIHPLDQPRPRPQRDHSIVPRMVQLGLVPGEGRGERREEKVTVRYLAS